MYRASGHHPVPRATRIAAAQGLVSRRRHSRGATAWTTAVPTCTCAARARPKTAWVTGCKATVPAHQCAVMARQCEQRRPAHSTPCRGRYCQQHDSCPLPHPPFPLASAAATMPLAGASGGGMLRVRLGEAGMEEQDGVGRGESGQGTEKWCGARARRRTIP